MQVYAFRHSSCTPEESMCVQSLHRTKSGAQRALQAHKAAEKAKAGRRWESDERGNGFQRWDIEKYKVED